MNKEIVDVVKRQLWRNGMRVKDVSGSGLGFDLLVNGRHKVKVEMRVPITRVQKKLNADMIVAIVGEMNVEYYQCAENTCHISKQSLDKLFNV